MVTIKAKETVAHGRHFLHKGQTAQMPEATAKDLADAGLVEIQDEKKAPKPENKMAPEAENKSGRKPRNKAE